MQVDKLVEADLRVASRGGDVVVGSARGGEVRLDASCPGAGARQAGALKVRARALAQGLPDRHQGACCTRCGASGACARRATHPLNPPLQVREVSASQVWLLGGAAELQRVVGRDVRISVMQAQGAAAIGVMYADRAAVQTGAPAARGAPARPPLPCAAPCVLCSLLWRVAGLGLRGAPHMCAGGAALQVGQLNCTESAEVSTSGGSVSISNVDSSVSVSTAGGSIQVSGMRARVLVGRCAAAAQAASIARSNARPLARGWWCAGAPERQSAQRQPRQRRRRRGRDGQPQHCGQAAG